MSEIDLQTHLTRDLPVNRFAAMLAVGLAGGVLADWLFLDQGIPGLSLVVFLGVLALVAIVANSIRARGRTIGAAFAILAAGMVVLIEDVGPLSALFGIAATLVFTLLMAGGQPLRLVDVTPRVARLPFLGILWLADDFLQARRLLRDRHGATRALPSLIAWIVPAAALLVFGSLFASANPLLENWFSLLDPRWLLAPNSILRMRHVFVWVVILCLIWPLLHFRPSFKTVQKTIVETNDAKTHDGVLFGASAILRSLVLLNALFALQSALDLAYLWAGMSLPYGMSYATYAHRGAYPLLITALLAAAFVLVVMQRGGPAKKSNWIRPLVLAWVGQNILLMISAIMRLNLYVAAYSLTYLRLSAFIWMALVAVGLLLIVVQILRDQSNSWLLEMNARTLALALFGVCLLNVPAFVANYNVAHCAQTRGSGPRLDEEYLWSLGPEAIPAIDAFARVAPGHKNDGVRARAEFVQQLSDSWRGWSFRTWRLRRYLAMNPGIVGAADLGAPSDRP